VTIAAARRPTCERCGRPAVGCWCRDLPRLDTRTRVVLVQHPREARTAIGTARMAHLCLPNSALFVGETVDDPLLLAEISDPARPAVLLFPAPDAPDILAAPPEGPVTLVVVDGTWSQAGKLVRRNLRLAALPRYAFRPPRASEYRIRREPRPDCVSTIEALAFVLGALEGAPDRARALLEPFRRMVDFQVGFIARDRRPRMRMRSEGAPPPFDPTAPLAAHRGDLVLAAAEANGWPRPRKGRALPDAATVPPDGTGRDEPVHWVAFRPATGERFEAVIAPRAPLAPATVAHTGIPEAALRDGETPEAFLERWRAFLRPGDALCTWGRHAIDLVSDHPGAVPATWIDARRVARELHRGRIGPVEAWCAVQGVPVVPLGRGRAGRRLGQLAAAVGRMLADRG